MNKKIEYNLYKKKNKDRIVLLKCGSFYKTYDRDALIMWNMFNYKFIGNVVSFPFCVIYKVIRKLNNGGTSVVVINNNEVKLYENNMCNNYFNCLLSAIDNYEINEKVDFINNIFKIKIRKDIKNYNKILEYLSTL